MWQNRLYNIGVDGHLDPFAEVYWVPVLKDVSLRRLAALAVIGDILEKIRPG
jgi:hypothetical protein